MALSTYTELKATMAGWANRTDLTSEIVDAITLAEGRMYDSMILKDMESDEALTLTIGRNYVALPTGYISPISFWIVVSSLRIKLTAALPEELPYSVSNSQPQLWAIDGVNVRFDCPVIANYSAFLRCVKKTALSASVATNYLFARRPDIYLAGSLSELSRKTKDAELFNTWEPRFLRGCAELKAAESRNRGLAPLRTDIPTRGRSNIINGE